MLSRISYFYLNVNNETQIPDIDLNMYYIHFYVLLILNFSGFFISPPFSKNLNKT